MKILGMLAVLTVILLIGTVTRHNSETPYLNKADYYNKKANMYIKRKELPEAQKSIDSAILYLYLQDSTDLAKDSIKLLNK